MDNPFDRMSYYCLYCKHEWIFRSEKLGTDEQVKNWFNSVLKEHLEVCEIYRKHKGG